MYQPSKIGDKPIDVVASETWPKYGCWEKCPQQEGIIHKICKRPRKEYQQESSELHTQVDIENLVQRYLPRQGDLDEIL